MKRITLAIRKFFTKKEKGKITITKAEFFKLEQESVQALNYNRYNIIP